MHIYSEKVLKVQSTLAVVDILIAESIDISKGKYVTHNISRRPFFVLDGTELPENVMHT